MFKVHRTHRWFRLAVGGMGLAVLASCKDNTSPTVHGDVNIPASARTLTTAAFPPNPFSVSLSGGGTVTWANLDITSSSYGVANGVVHRIVSNTPLFDSGNLKPNSTYSFTFSAPGTYAYHCALHPAMVGTIRVTP